jgi:hypothetical protein
MYDVQMMSFSAWDSVGSGRRKLTAFAVVLRATLEQFWTSFSAWDSVGSGRRKLKAFAVVLRATLEQF